MSFRFRKMPFRGALPPTIDLAIAVAEVTLYACRVAKRVWSDGKTSGKSAPKKGGRGGSAQWEG